MSVKNVMIMGSDGYIGTNLSNYLKTKKDISLWLYDLARGTQGENFETVEGFDAVVLLAAFPGVINCRGNIKRAVIDNISVAFRILNLAAQHSVPVIFTSSQAAKQPFDNFYATIKKIIEIEALRLNKQGALNKILRLTNVYGGEQYIEKKNTVVKQFFMARKNKIKMVINGDGSQIRDFIHVYDVCRAIYKCILCTDKIPEPIDIGTGFGITIKNLATMFDTEFAFIPDSDTIGSLESIADIRQAREILNFTAQEDLTKYILEK